MDYKELLEFSRRITNSTLREILENIEIEAKRVHGKVVDLPYIAKDYTLRGGKRIRAFLVLIGYWSRNWSSGNVDEVKYIMAGIEFLQSYLLVHDDVMDRDEIRRGGPTVHVWFIEKCVKQGLLGDCVHYGISQAITTGDYLESLAIYCFSKSKLPGRVLAKLYETYTRGLRLVSYGQFLDVLTSLTPIEKVDEEDIYTIHKLKTSSYTVELPLHLGAIASQNYNETLLRELSNYAYPAGIAFQLRDDIIGLFGDPKITGKPVGSDIREKKKTLLIVYAYKHANDDEKKFLREIYDCKKPEEITDEDVIRVQEIVKETGGLSYTENAMKKFAEEAYESLENATEINDVAKNVLAWLLDLFIKRKK